MISLRVASLLALMTVSSGLTACSGASQPAQRASATVLETTPADIAALSDPRVRYFHEQLVVNGEDLQSEFGGYLLTLGLNPRDLQQDDPKHAYDTVLEKVRGVKDASSQRLMMRTFFNSTD